MQSQRFICTRTVTKRAVLSGKLIHPKGCRNDSVVDRSIREQALQGIGLHRRSLHATLLYVATSTQGRCRTISTQMVRFFAIRVPSKTRLPNRWLLRDEWGMVHI
eukprot:1201689-Amphidinium_carterae.1